MQTKSDPLRRWALLLILTLSPVVAIATDTATQVTVVEAVVRDLAVTVEAPGQVESLGQPLVAAEVEGRILALSVDEGESMVQGGLLAELDAEPYRLTLRQTEAERSRLAAQIENQERTLERFRDLAGKHSSAQSDVDQAATDLAVLRAQLAGVEARIAEAEYRLTRCRVVSPVTGAVQQRMVSVGEYVKVGTPLFQVVATDRLRARLYLPESMAARVRIGQPVTLTLPGGAGELTDASITALRPMLEAGSRGLEALVDFPNPGGWRPGYSLGARLILETHPGAVMIPRASLVLRPAGTVVYRVEEGHARAQVVETGLHDGDWVEVLSGLAAGERVVLDGAGFLSDGAPVAITPAQQP